MPLKVTESQGTTAYLLAVGTAVGTAAAVKTAVAAGKQINCLLDLGDIALGSRSSQEYTCMSSDESFKSLGSVSLANITPSLLYDTADTAGQQDLMLMWTANTRRIMVVALNDQITPTTGNPTYIVYEVAVSAPTIGIAKDNAVMFNPTLEITTKPVLFKAV